MKISFEFLSELWSIGKLVSKWANRITIVLKGLSTIQTFACGLKSKETAYLTNILPNWHGFFAMIKALKFVGFIKTWKFIAWPVVTPSHGYNPGILLGKKSWSLVLWFNVIKESRTDRTRKIFKRSAHKYIFEVRKKLIGAFWWFHIRMFLKSIKATSFTPSATGSEMFFFHFSMFCVIKKGPSYVVSCSFLSILI